MNETLSTNIPLQKKVGVWAEGTHIEAKEYVLPNKSPESNDNIPTIPDLDDLQDILDQEISVPPSADQKDKETVNTLAEVGGAIGGSTDSIEAVLEMLHRFIPDEEPDTADNVWTIDSLLAQLVEEYQVKK